MILVSALKYTGILAVIIYVVSFSFFYAGHLQMMSYRGWFFLKLFLFVFTLAGQAMLLRLRKTRGDWILLSVNSIVWVFLGVDLFLHLIYV